MQTLSLFAVHLSDGALADAWLAGGFVGGALLLAVAMWRMREDDVPRVGVLTAAFFVGSSIHFPLAVLPTSVHLILNGLVGVVLGRRAPLAVAVGLALQYLLLSHGGLTTLGVNACIVGLPALAAGAAYPALRRLGVPAFARGVLLGGGAAATAVTLNFLVLLFGGKEDWRMLARLVLLAHVPIVLIEGLMLGVLVAYLEKVKPEMLWPGVRSQESEDGKQETGVRSQESERKGQGTEETPADEPGATKRGRE
jgi:cobalt/nickel transport system permease protein